MTKISVFGLGYVGAVSMACLADLGYEVIGIDINPTKVDMINAGRSPVIEPGLSDMLCEGCEQGLVSATSDAARAVMTTGLSIICVGTPSNGNGSLDLRHVQKVSEEIGACLADKPDYHVVVLRSTVLPGKTEEVVIPALEKASGKTAGRDFGVCFNPEFLREGSSVKDFFDPPFTVIGGTDARAIAAVAALYETIDPAPEIVPVKLAEMVKYSCNAFHALKVTFGNEIGNICKEQGIDSHKVMEIFCRDTKLNLSPYYLKPGFAFGGSCLPKDLRALIYHARHQDVFSPVLESILPSNDSQVDRAFEMVRQTGARRIGVLGFSFKAGTDDLRESPMVALIERLIGKGYEVCVYDRNVSLANLYGANKAYIEREIPHIATLMAESLRQVVEHSEVIVVGNKAAEFRDILGEVRPDQKILDLVRITEDAGSLNGSYEGICW